MTDKTLKLENIISGHGINADDADWLRALTQPQPQEQQATSDEVIELACALEVRRILEAIKTISKLHPAGDMPTPYQAAWQSCCEEIFFQATGEHWHMDEDDARFHRSANDSKVREAQQAAAVPAGWREFIENIATAGSEPLNSLAGGSDKASRRRWLSVIRDKASDLLSSAPAAPQSDDELLAQALGALQYHTEQTRPIERTRLAIEAIDRRLHGGITGGEEPTP